MITVSQVRNVVLRRTFEFGFEEISRAYHMTLKAQVELEAEAEATVRKRSGLTPDEVVPEVEHDENGQPSFDFWEEVGELKDEAESTARIVRSAFLIALFHFWERHSNRWIDKENYSHEPVMAWLKTQNSTPDEALLKDLQLAANCVKHGPGNACNKLLARRPELFEWYSIDQSRMGVFPESKPGHHNIKIDSKTLQAFFEAVSRSGPKAGQDQDQLADKATL